MSSPTQAQMYLDHLRAEGFVPELTGESEIRFKMEGGLYQILIDARDPVFFRLIYPSFRKIRDPQDRARVEAAVNQATANTKVAKVYLTKDDNVSAAVELFCWPPEAFKPVFERSLQVLRYAVKDCKQHAG